MHYLQPRLQRSAPTYKRAIPRVVDHIRRSSLLSELADATAKAPITWVSGLPGAGKTSLVARWVETSEVPVVWYRLDTHDADVAPVFDALQAALEARKLPEWSPENQANLVDFARDFFAELAREPLVLVFDDCHRIPDASPTLTVLEELRHVAGQNLRLVLISRRAPPPALARGLVGGWVRAIDDLRLSKEETLAIASAVRGGALSAAETTALDRADGWLAHVLTLARTKRRTEDLPPDLERHVGEFLAAELLASLPASQRPTFRRLAELPEIPRDLAGPEVARLLGGLADKRHFVDTIESRWRLHDLLRDALRALNAEEDDKPTLDASRRELATRVSRGMPEAAMQLRVDAGDAEGVRVLLEARGAEWLARGMHRTVVGWLAQLDDPALAFWRAQALLPLEPEVARPLFSRARKLGVERKDPLLAYEAWCGEVASYVVQWGAVHGLADLVDDLEALQVALGPPPGDLGFRTSADALTALMYGRAEDRRTAAYAEKTARAIEHAIDPGARISAAGQLLIYRLWWAGDFPGGRALYAAFDDQVSRGYASPVPEVSRSADRRPREELAPLSRLIWWSCAAIVDWQCGKAQDCYDKVERGLALAASSGVHVRDFFLLTQGIFCALSQEDWTRAERYLTQLARTEREHLRLDAMVHHFFRSWFALCRGDPRAALVHAQTAWPMADAMGSMFHKVIVLSALGPARLHSGDVEGAEEAYRMQIELAKAAQNPTFSFIAFCMGSEIAIAKKDDARLTKQVERMLFVKMLGGFHSHCGWRTPMMQKVLSFAFEKGIHPEIATQWVREKGIGPPAPAPPNWPMRLRIVARKGLVVERDGVLEETTAGVKSAQKLRELLAVLVAKPGGATAPELVDWLWPDAEGDKAQASLKAAVHRLRQWLGNDAVRVHEGRTSLNTSLVGCDVWNLKEPLAEAEDVLEGFDLAPVQTLRRRLKNGLRL